jgi:hypothetical protein
VLVNQYSRPGFQAWWIALAVSALLDIDLHWVITSGWVYEDPLRSMTITPLSRFMLRRIAFEDDSITSFVLANEPSNLTLEFAMQQSLQNIEGDFRVLSRQVIDGAIYEMGRFIIEVHDPELDRDGRQLLYVIIYEGQAYTLGYQTLKSKFESQVPIFEISASTFTIK